MLGDRHTKNNCRTWGTIWFCRDCANWRCCFVDAREHFLAIVKMNHVREEVVANNRASTPL